MATHTEPQVDDERDVAQRADDFADGALRENTAGLQRGIRIGYTLGTIRGPLNRLACLPKSHPPTLRQ